MKSSFAIPIAIASGGIIVAIAVMLSTEQMPTDDARNRPELVRPVSATDHILGNPSASIKIIVYSDYYCQFCKHFNETMHQLIANEGVGGKIAWVYRHFPLTEINPNAIKAARAAECAALIGGNDAFWRFSSALFKSYPADPSRYGVLARASGITSDDFASCYADTPSDIEMRIQSDKKNALLMGAKGAPFSVLLVTGSVPLILDGAYSYEALRQIVKQALAQQ